MKKDKIYVRIENVVSKTLRKNYVSCGVYIYTAYK